MIWIERSNKNIIFYTSDGMIFNNIKDAIIHIKDDTDNLIMLSQSFDKLINRNKKIQKLISNFNYPTI